MSDDNNFYSADELVAPDWLNNDFFQDILSRKHAGKAVKINKVTITPGTSKSEHYTSVMFRAKISYNLLPDESEIVQSLIIKTTATTESEKKEFLDSFDVFETEIKMYTETLPKIQSILRQNGDNTKIYADLFYHSLNPHKCIIFEDLVELGYTTISERHCSIEEVKAAFLKLAKMHAVSYKLVQEGDTSITQYNEGSFGRDEVLQMKLVAEGLKIFKETLIKYDDLRSYVSHVEKIESDILQRIKQSFNAYKNGKRDGIFVLNHGDCHIKNVMNKKIGEKLDDVILVDFQMSVYASPAIDLIYAFVMLFSPDMRLHHRDELFYYYLTNFQETLKLIGFSGRIPTLIDFQKELLDHAHFEIYLTSAFLVTNYLLLDPKADLVKYVENENYRRELWKRQDFIQEMRTLLPLYLHKGYFGN